MSQGKQRGEDQGEKKAYRLLGGEQSTGAWQTVTEKTQGGRRRQKKIHRTRRHFRKGNPPAEAASTKKKRTPRGKR